MPVTSDQAAARSGGFARGAGDDEAAADRNGRRTGLRFVALPDDRRSAKRLLGQFFSRVASEPAGDDALRARQMPEWRDAKADAGANGARISAHIRRRAAAAGVTDDGRAGKFRFLSFDPVLVARLLRHGRRGEIA